ncbi:DUF2809 domain-containing protein [Plantibacter sp. Mn2098]|uniref:ribosomal maturation YjgA family protein n=1 Tax=Plantibacter sp. Mn2098 TaxID=3395266 RepID=UPI003BE1D864
MTTHGRPPPPPTGSIGFISSADPIGSTDSTGSIEDVEPHSGSTMRAGRSRRPARACCVSTRQRRLILAIAAACTIVVGLAVHTFGRGPLADPAGDVLYAVMASLLVAFLMPQWSVWLVAFVAFVFCAGIELFQATGVPSSLAEQWSPTALVLGTTFVPTDLLAYAAGAGLVLIVSLGVAVVARWIREDRRTTRSRNQRAERITTMYAERERAAQQAREHAAHDAQERAAHDARGHADRSDHERPLGD